MVYISYYTKKTWVGGFVLSLMLLGLYQFAYSQPQSILLLDDFESYPLNSLDNETSVFDINADIGRQLARDTKAFGHAGRTLQLNFDVSADTASACGDVSFLPSLDLSEFHYLSFRVRSAQGGEYFQIELKKENGESAKVAVWNYLPCGLTTEWQKVVIPLDAFWNLTQRTKLVEFVIAFDHYTAVANDAPQNGELYFDDFVFGTYFPGFLKLDPFSDRINANATGGNNGNFEPPGPELNYSSEVNCAGGTASTCNCQQLLRYDHTRGDAFGGAFFILGGGSDGWTPVPKDLSAYDLLYLEAVAESGATNPGNFKVELKQTDPDSTVSTFPITGVSTIKKSYKIPFTQFSPALMPETGIREFTVVVTIQQS